MRNKLLLILCLALCTLVLASCSNNDSQERFELLDTSQQTQQVNFGNASATAAADSGSVLDDLIDYDDGTYDPASEEDLDSSSELDASIFNSTYEPVVEVTAAPTVNSEYAGASPVVIDPIDKPTPTPLPEITFSFQTYSATKLHLSFDAPIGWTIDDSGSTTYILTQPDSEAIPGYNAQITVSVVTVNSQYSASDLSKEVLQMLDTIGESSFSSISKSNTASRTLLGSKGSYANYTAVTSDGVEAAGRVHVTCIDKVLYSVHITYPRDYRDTYVDQVYSAFRKTVKITQ